MAINLVRQSSYFTYKIDKRHKLHKLVHTIVEVKSNEHKTYESRNKK